MYNSYSRKHSKLKNFLLILLIIIFSSLASIYIYKTYSEIEIDGSSKIDYDTSKLSSIQSPEAYEKTPSNNIENTIELVSQSIVGISKLKNNGTSIFLSDSSSSLNLGTGIIISENGYILTNEHVSGAKYSTCYITLESGNSYTGNVIWSDSDIDLAIVKINMNGLKAATLGDSDTIAVGQGVYAIRKSYWIWISKNCNIWNY